MPEPSHKWAKEKVEPGHWDFLGPSSFDWPANTLRLSAAIPTRHVQLKFLNTHLDTRGLACAYFIDSKRGVLDVETLQATAIPSSRLGRHESFYEAVFQFRKWALSQRGDGKLELQAGFARIVFVVQNQTVILELRLIMGPIP